MLNLTFITGAGISHAAGLPLYTSSESSQQEKILSGFSAQDLVTNRTEVIYYYNERAKAISLAEATDAHHLITSLNAFYNIHVITQNIDNLHELAKTENVIHIHGHIGEQLTDAKCCQREITYAPILADEHCKHGSKWRHGIVLYGEPVQQFDLARRILAITDVLIVIGCSMQTNSAMNLVKQVHEYCPVYFINPAPENAPKGAIVITQEAYSGIWTALQHLTA